jgi:hypothetical protein
MKCSLRIIVIISPKPMKASCCQCRWLRGMQGYARPQLQNRAIKPLGRKGGGECGIDVWGGGTCNQKLGMVALKLLNDVSNPVDLDTPS